MLELVYYAISLGFQGSFSVLSDTQQLKHLLKIFQHYSAYGSLQRNALNNPSSLPGSLAKPKGCLRAPTKPRGNDPSKSASLSALVRCKPHLLRGGVALISQDHLSFQPFYRFTIGHARPFR